MTDEMQVLRPGPRLKYTGPEAAQEYDVYHHVVSKLSPSHQMLFELRARTYTLRPLPKTLCRAETCSRLFVHRA